MVTFPHAKINLGLNVVERRSDGYHNMETVFYPVQWCDIMEIVPGPQHSKGIELHLSGLPVAGKHADNLCVKAYELLKKQPGVRAVRVYLNKQIPMGAGLGGGSADAAFFVKEVNRLFSLGMPVEEMQSLVRKIGADCAFFIEGKPVYATERGDHFASVQCDLSGYYLMIVHPGIHVSTAQAFASITPVKPTINCCEIVEKHPITDWKNLLVNDFEKTVFRSHPGIAAIKEQLYDSGAIYASMSGSGSAVFGLFQQAPDAAMFSDQAFRTYTAKL